VFFLHRLSMFSISTNSYSWLVSEVMNSLSCLMFRFVICSKMINVYVGMLMQTFGV